MERYRIISTTVGSDYKKGFGTIEKEVNDLYKKGWKPHGPLSIMEPNKESYCSDKVVYQAMINEAEDTCIICGATRCHFLNYEGKLICAKCAGGIKNMI